MSDRIKCRGDCGYDYLPNSWDEYNKGSRPNYYCGTCYEAEVVERKKQGRLFV